MADESGDTLELEAGGGWLRDGRPWAPTAPFYAVLGDPIAHSLSPRIQAAALRARGLEAEYLRARLPAGSLASLRHATWDHGLAGCNVTAPLKGEMAALCDELTAAAREVGAVNTVRMTEGIWQGHNTDVGGVEAVLAQAWPPGDPPRRVVLLGAGGSARAAAAAVARWGCETLVVGNRSAAGRERFAAWFADSTLPARGLRCEVVPLDRLRDPPPPTEPSAWIACLAGGVPVSPYLPAAAAGGPCLLLDLRYGDQRPPETPPLGFDVVDGIPVLLIQAGLSFTWWFGPPVPWSAMSASLEA